ncbi:TMEM165/GDT1 family protein [Sphingomonas sp.]|uniref:TMEM165/GDT1 family protein n=1 Tax=Sphingomonas sp. TaxID=28214 RepID=UPI0035C81370
MDAFMAALVLGALTQGTERTPWLAAILADRWRRPGRMPLLLIVAAMLALAINYAIGVAAGMALTTLLTPAAKQLLLALALVLAGVGTGWRVKRPDDLAGWRVGRTVTALAGLFIMAFGDRMQFIVAALAIRSPLPWASAVGATIGALAAIAPAALLGEAAWCALPWRAIRLSVAAILTVAGIILGLSAVSLI